MAAGDVVSAMSAPTTIMTFIPAAGVEVLITMASASVAGGSDLRYWDGAVQSRYFRPQQLDCFMTGELRMWLKNSLGLILALIVGEGTVYSGVQTK